MEQIIEFFNFVKSLFEANLSEYKKTIIKILKILINDLTEKFADAYF